MRGLIWPTYSYAGNVATDSLYIIARNLIRVTPEVKWYLIVPDWHGKIPEDELDDMPWVTKVPTPMPMHYRLQESTMDPETMMRFSPQDGDLPVEIVVQMSPMRTLNMTNAYSVRVKPPDRPIMVTWDLLARDDRNKEYVADEIELMHNAAGAWVSDLNAHESPICEWMVTYSGRKFLAPSGVRKLQQTSATYEQGIPWGVMAEAVKGVKKREKFSVYYGGRFAASKRFDDLAEIIDAAYRFGRDMEFVVCTGSVSGPVERKLRERFPQMELNIGTNQTEAWRIQASCHASLCFSRGELFGMSFWEQIGGGLAVVMKTEKWNEDMLPEDYDLWASSGTETAARLRLLYEEFQESPEAFDERYGWNGRWAGYVRERYAEQNLRAQADHMIALAEERRRGIWAKFDRGTKGDLLEIAQKVLTEGMTWEEYLTAMRAESRIGVRFVGDRMGFPKSNTTLDAYRVAAYLGWQDVGADSPIWSKEK